MQDDLVEEVPIHDDPPPQKGHAGEEDVSPQPLLEHCLVALALRLLSEVCFPMRITWLAVIFKD